MVRRNLFTFVFVGILLSGAWCWLAEASERGPKAYLPQSVFEFTPVVEGTEIVHEFILRNQGDAPLKILKIESG